MAETKAHRRRSSNNCKQRAIWVQRPCDLGEPEVNIVLGTMLSRVNELAEGELVLVRSGDRVPVDGVIREGKSNLNESMITGENTKLSGIMRLVSEAQESKSRSQLLADRAAQMLTGVAISAALITLVVWQLVDAPIDFTVVRGL